MTILKELPIFCEQCATLALATLDDAALCESCLLEQVHSHGGKLSAVKIAPLQFVPPKTIYQADNGSFLLPRY